MCARCSMYTFCSKDCRFALYVDIGYKMKVGSPMGASSEKGAKGHHARHAFPRGLSFHPSRHTQQHPQVCPRSGEGPSHPQRPTQIRHS